MSLRKSALRGIGMFAAAYVASYTAVASLKRISGASMQPTLNPTGDWVLVNNFVLRLRRGDVVIAKSPNGDLVCKRVCAVAGETISTTLPTSAEISSDFFDLVAAASPPNLVPVVTQTITVPEKHVWLEGDNPAASFDSRAYGPVPMRHVRGRVVARVWPLSQIGFIQHGDAPPASPPASR